MQAKFTLMNPKRYLLVGGSLLVTSGLLGIINVLGALSSAAFFHPPSWINWLHLSVGSLVLAIAFVGPGTWQVGITLLGAMLLTTIGLLGLLVYVFGLVSGLGLHTTAFAANPEFADPSDHIVHLTVGLLAVWGWSNRPRSRH